jgi:hypothetical protein
MHLAAAPHTGTAGAQVMVVNAVPAAIFATGCRARKPRPTPYLGTVAYRPHSTAAQGRQCRSVSVAQGGLGAANKQGRRPRGEQPW